MELSRKITISTVTGGPAKWFEDLMKSDAKRLNLMAVYGFANGYKAGASEFGEFVKINGNFRAVNKITGEIMNSPQLILPTYIGDSMRGALDMPGRQGPIKFAFEIDAKYDPSAVTKYVYVVNDILPAQNDDPLSGLGVQLSYEKPLAIANSAATTEVAVAPAPVAAATKGRK